MAYVFYIKKKTHKGTKAKRGGEEWREGQRLQEKGKEEEKEK
jgi:hypothetical protein